MDPKERFSRVVDDYQKHRPDYPSALLDWIVADAKLGQGARVLDVGCGTGISTRALAERGLVMIGADPNAAMLEAARKNPASSGAIEYVQADAETLVGVEGPFAAIVGGQSFHWLDLTRARARFAELLAPGGRVIAFWNLRDGSDAFMQAYEALILEWSPRYPRVGAEPRATAIMARSDLDDLRGASFEGHTQELERAAFHGRVWSSSYVKNAITDREAFDAALDRLFDQHARGGAVRFVYRSVAASFRP